MTGEICKHCKGTGEVTTKDAVKVQLTMQGGWYDWSFDNSRQVYCSPCPNRKCRLPQGES